MASQQDAGASAKGFLGEQAGLLVDKGFSFSGFERDVAFLNRGDGTFVDVSGCSGLDSITDGRAAVFADFDNDGDADVFLRAMHSQAHLLFRNDFDDGSAGFVRIALRGTASGPDAFGAVVRVRVGDHVTAQTKLGGQGFMAQSDPRLLFGLGGAPRADAIDVTWPSGRRQSFGGAESGTSLLIVEGEDGARAVKEKRFRLPDPWSAADRALAATALRRGEPLPPLRVTDLDGADASVPVAPGRRTVVNFWAPWCAPCRAEMPELQRIASEGHVDVVGICADAKVTAEAARAALTAVGASYPQRMATEQALGAVFRDGRVALPTSVVLDERGRVLDVVSGGRRADATRLKRALLRPPLPRR